MSERCSDCKEEIPRSEDPTYGRCDDCESKHEAGPAEEAAAAPSKPKARPKRRKATRKG